MDFNDKRFGGRDNEKDRTVPPDENYYANNNFDPDYYKRNRYGKENSRTPQRNYDFDDNNEYSKRELSPSEEFYKNFNTAFSDEHRNYSNPSYNSDYDISSHSDYDNAENIGRNHYSRDIYSSFESRRAIDDFDVQPRNRIRENTPQRSKSRKTERNTKNKNTILDNILSRSGNDNQPKKKRKKNKLKPIIIALSAILAIIIIIGATGLTALARINYNEKHENRYVNSADLKSSKDVTNILLLGVDARADEEGNASRSDTMILVSIDKAHNCIKMTSFLRDSWVYIPCKDTWQRLNAACSYGGYSAVADTIEYNFGVKIDGYLVADFEMFKVMIDGLGGVKIDVTEEEADEVTNHKARYGNVELKSGKHKLTGEQALAYCRIRKIDTDWVRTERQRTVMEAVFKKAAVSPIKDLKMISKIASYLDTDLTKSEIMGLALKIIGNVSGGFKQQACPFDGTWDYTTRNGASVIWLNIDTNKEKIIDYIYGDNSETE